MEGCLLAGDGGSQVGTGDRSERIRTYNFPENRVSDHRIKLTIYKLDQFLNGDMDEILDDKGSGGETFLDRCPEG